MRKLGVAFVFAALLIGVGVSSGSVVPGQAGGGSGGGGGVTSITGTANQVIVTGTTTPTLSLPQSIATASTPQFAALGFGGAAGATGTAKFFGSSSGSVLVSAPAAAGTTTFTLPGSNGTNGWVLTTNGSGVTSWAAAGGGGVTWPLVVPDGTADPAIVGPTTGAFGISAGTVVGGGGKRLELHGGAADTGSGSSGGNLVLGSGAGDGAGANGRVQIVTGNDELASIYMYADGEMDIGGVIVAFSFGSSQTVTFDTSGAWGNTSLGKASSGWTNFFLDYTNSGTVGNVTINKASGRCNVAGAGTSVTVTNSLVTANSHVFAVVSTNDATAFVQSVVPASGSFVIRLGAAATAQTSIDFVVIGAD